MNYYEHNLAKIAELHSVPQWNAHKAMDDCFSQNLLFHISEAYRTQERQNALYAQGRTKPGTIVTWTLDSDHTRRVAIDIYPINCTHEQLAPIFAKWGIAHPWPTNDPPHYSLSDTKSLLTARMGFYLLSVGRIANPLRKAAVLRAIDRIRRQLGV